MAGYNSKEIKTLSTAKTSKDDPFDGHIITDPAGQWKYPGQVTRIPSNEITMKGVNYPVLGVDDKGNSKMMMPGEDYTFPGQYVTEYPMMQGGGWLDEVDEMRRGGEKRSLTRNKTHKNIKTSLNFIMARNHDVYGFSGLRFYDPNSKYEMGGGWLDNI